MDIDKPGILVKLEYQFKLKNRQKGAGMEQNMFFLFGLALIACGKIGRQILKAAKAEAPSPLSDNVVSMDKWRSKKAAGWRSASKKAS